MAVEDTYQELKAVFERKSDDDTRSRVREAEVQATCGGMDLYTIRGYIRADPAVGSAIRKRFSAPKGSPEYQDCPTAHSLTADDWSKLSNIDWILSNGDGVR